MVVQYIRTNSALHRMDPLSKLISLIIITALVFVLGQTWLYIALFLALSFAALVLGGVSVKTYLGTAWLFFLVGGGLFLFHLVATRGGNVAFSVGGLHVYQGGLTTGIQKMFTMVIIALSSLIFVWTTNPRRLVVGLVYAGLPYRYAWALFLALRFVPVFQSELEIVRDAQAVRGIREGSGLSGKIEMYKRYLVPVLVSAVRKSTAVAIAMDCRGFGAYPTRTFVDAFRWSACGVATAGFLGAWFVFMVARRAIG